VLPHGKNLALVSYRAREPLTLVPTNRSLARPWTSHAARTVAVLPQDGVWTALAAAIYFVVYGQLEGNALAPFVYRRTAHVNPLVTLLAILFLVEFMGVAGAIVAVPVAAAAQVFIAEIVTVRREQARRHEPPGSIG